MAPVKLVPVMVTVVPPAVGPEVGEMEVMVGVRRGVGELVGRHGRAGPVRGGHIDVVPARRLGRGDGGDLGGGDHGEAGGRHGAEDDLGGPGEVGPGDGDRGAPGRSGPR